MARMSAAACRASSNRRAAMPQRVSVVVPQSPQATVAMWISHPACAQANQRPGTHEFGVVRMGHQRQGAAMFGRNARCVAHDVFLRIAFMFFLYASTPGWPNGLMPTSRPSTTVASISIWKSCPSDPSSSRGKRIVAVRRKSSA